jgi:hypothetical protein
MLEKTGAMTRSRAKTRACKQRAIRPLLVDLERLIVGELEDVGHRVAVAPKRQLGLLVGIERWLSLHSRDDVVDLSSR